jgi:anti-anti-sigma regulatory factor
MQHLAVRTVFTEHQATLVISGEVDICTGPAVERALGEALNQRPERLVLDLGGMSACFLAEPDARTAAGDRTSREHHG